MRCDTGLLRAYLDDALLPSEQTAVAEHLTDCEACRAELTTLRERNAAVATRLATLEPAPGAIPHPAIALERFLARSDEHVMLSERSERSIARPVPRGASLGVRRNRSWLTNPLGVTGASVWETITRSFEMTKQTLFAPKWRPFAAGVAAVLALAILFSFAPVRQVAADFLGLFRVRKFAVIPVDPAKTSQLESLAQMADAGKFGMPTFVREPGKGQPVADAAQASQIAGFTVRTPATLPDSATQRHFTVDVGPAVHYEMDRAMMQAVLDATGIQNVKLPDTDKVVIDVDVPMIVSQSFAIGDGSLSFSAGTLELIQAPSPSVNMPPGVDPAALGEAAFQFLGMPAADAHRLAQAIDWTSTVVIPLPTDVAQYREVTVDGVTGLLLEEKRSARTSGSNSVLLWQRDGMVYAMNATNVDVKVLLMVADSLR
ncbi:MAG: zf-HC2 domain-containing protein [Chloroflexi bacterium]|nr:zf-HC2 domain-containing protein [Chloroflexota bacterium]